jgi:hypothetical protein
MSILVKGYVIRIQRGDAGWKSEKQHAWAPAGQLPAEWEAVTQDPEVVSAEIFLGSQQRFKPDKRKILAEFSRQVERHAEVSA